MKAKVKSVRIETIEVSAVVMELPVLFNDEDIPNDYPHRSGDKWNITVDAATGKIRDWPKGVKSRNVRIKVHDAGSYCLLDEAGMMIALVEQDYVPDYIPGDLGDYVDFKIDENGVITNWDGDVEIEVSDEEE